LFHRLLEIQFIDACNLTIAIFELGPLGVNLLHKEEEFDIHDSEK